MEQKQIRFSEAMPAFMSHKDGVLRLKNLESKAVFKPKNAIVNF